MIKVTRLVFLTIKHTPEDSDSWDNAHILYETVDSVTVTAILDIMRNLPHSSKFRIWRQDRHMGDNLVIEGNSAGSYWNRTNLDN